MPSENDLEFDLFLEAFEDYREAKESHDKARGAYTGYSWGYHGNYEIEALDRTRNVLRERFREIIRAEVKASMAEGEQ